MVPGEGRAGSRQASAKWELTYELRYQAGEDPQIECTIYSDGPRATPRLRAVRLTSRIKGPVQNFSDREITTVASEVGTLLTVRLEDDENGSSEHLMVVLPPVPIVSGTPDEHMFDHVAATAVIQKQEPQPGDVGLPDRPHVDYRTLDWDANEHSGSSVLVRRRRGGGGN